jgi:polyhydroxybutyrate depolymerase
MHGGGGEMWGTSRFLDFHSLAASEGFLVAYPNAVDKHWSDGRTETLPKLEYLAKVDDVKYLTRVIDDVASACPVDAQRVFATGISNGGFMSQSLAVKASNRIAAIGAVVAGMGESVAASFSPTLPVSVLVINGTEDPLVPYAGGEVHFFRTKRGRTIGIEDVAAKWAAFNGCSSRPVVDHLPNLSPDDGCRVERRLFSGGKAGTEVVLLKIQGGGHTWPGGSQYLPVAVIGRTCRDFSATRLIWEFFRTHPRPGPGKPLIDQR